MVPGPGGSLNKMSKCTYIVKNQGFQKDKNDDVYHFMENNLISD